MIKSEFDTIDCKQPDRIRNNFLQRENSSASMSATAVTSSPAATAASAAMTAPTAAATFSAATSGSTASTRAGTAGSRTTVGRTSGSAFIFAHIAKLVAK